MGNRIEIKDHSFDVFRIVDIKRGVVVGSYSRAYHDEFDFRTCEDARTANCHGMFEDKKIYKIAKYRVTYTLIDDNVDGEVVRQEKENE